MHRGLHVKTDLPVQGASDFSSGVAGVRKRFDDVDVLQRLF